MSFSFPKIRNKGEVMTGSSRKGKSSETPLNVFPSTHSCYSTTLFVNHSPETTLAKATRDLITKPNKYLFSTLYDTVDCPSLKLFLPWFLQYSELFLSHQTPTTAPGQAPLHFPPCPPTAS